MAVGEFPQDCSGSATTWYRTMRHFEGTIGQPGRELSSQQRKAG